MREKLSSWFQNVKDVLNRGKDTKIKLQVLIDRNRELLLEIDNLKQELSAQVARNHNLQREIHKFQNRVKRLNERCSAYIREEQNLR